jgi:hypothetical protein
MVETIERINRNSIKVSEVTGIIEGIAFQTNLLALNAAVEAARAGSRGQSHAGGRALVSVVGGSVAKHLHVYTRSRPCNLRQVRTGQFAIVAGRRAYMDFRLVEAARGKDGSLRRFGAPATVARPPFTVDMVWHRTARSLRDRFVSEPGTAKLRAFAAGIRLIGLNASRCSAMVNLKEMS